MTEILEVNQLKKTYPESAFSLDAVTFSVPAGSITGFIGENGAGKTTTMGAITGTLHKDGGSVKVFGEPMDGTKDHLKEQIGVVFDSMNFSGELNPMQLSNVFSQIYSRWNRERYVHYLNLFKLPGKKKIGSFSKGMCMKLSIAVALSHDARLLILDEATSGLDPVAREDVLEVFSAFVRDGERAILLSSHITSDIEKVADNLIFIKNGTILLKVRKREVFETFALVQCEEGELERLDRRTVLAYRHTADGVDVLVKEKEKLPQGVRTRDFSIDDMTLLLMKGETDEGSRTESLLRY
ncbi:ABC transporter ATP-binding protein [Alteribacter natronophilus]|uniref:ABC transporter ATP-binding protein n=1 Tax=Alteribacter natronophilus TaxID=2583810 RepID=UPI00110DAA0B|nr:ABC transporter ATP-binding protein [Alteribacter natronophilus]TMW70921.1 ABC transporter ATP-binding protein [Alteribacter natronophilus]